METKIDRSSNSGGTYGFSALPGGNRNNNGDFNNEGNNANFWSSGEYNSNNAFNLNLNYNNDNANLNWNNKNNARSVRCLKDSGKFNINLLKNDLRFAYFQARKHKRNTHNQLEFEQNLESNLLALALELQNRTYEPLPSICFINEKPVKREIIAANFRDRVVHHLLYNWIYPIFDRQFIYDSYSCRVGKGTDFGINRAKEFMVSESRNFTRDCWALRLDISGFFMSINRDILYQLIIEGLRKAKWRGIPDRDLCLFLVKTFVFNDPLKNAHFRSPRSAWNDLPANKSLMGLPANQGLPIGNLTSQLFGNVYLNPLDQFVKHQLKIRCYGRYVDDMLLVHHDKSVLLNAIPKIRNFLLDRLNLNLNEKKTRLQPVSHGFPFLGAYILPWRTYPSRRTVKNFRECVRNPVLEERVQQSRIQSYLGYMGHYDAFKLASTFLASSSGFLAPDQSKHRCLLRFHPG
ncbi:MULTISPECIES: reverse transcriptase domain-containing protein [unclassified Fibrobacter]|uniref:reverse transcriptase domain-containing protein n=1 Tax=unclassified Fibrobacter TaxID=2634177 RepID=UPI001304A9E0|nr:MULTISPECIES: reverse transcriptase domain-containing protein [unclassified Fibrobacter]